MAVSGSLLKTAVSNNNGFIITNLSLRRIILLKLLDGGKCRRDMKSARGLLRISLGSRLLAECFVYN